MVDLHTSENALPASPFSARDVVVPGSKAERIVLISRWLLAAVAVLVVVRPHPSGMPGVISTYGADVVLSLLLGLSMLVIGLRVDRGSARWIAGFLAIGVLIAFLLLVASLNGSVAVETAAINLVRFSYYGFFLLIVGSLVQSGEPGWQGLNKFVAIALWANVAIASLQLFNPPVLGGIIYAVFGDDKLRDLWSGWPRVYGAFANANWFGVFIVFILTWVVARCLNRDLSLGTSLIYTGICLYLLVISGSRTAMIGAAVSIGIIFLIQRRYLLLIAAGGVAIQVPRVIESLQAQFPYLGRTLDRFSELASGLGSGEMDNIASLQGRQASWQVAWERVWEQPFLGYGDAGLGTNFIPHNGYLTLLLTVGLVGAIPILLWVTLMYMDAVLYKPRSAAAAASRIWLIAFSSGLAAMMAAADFVYTSQVMLLWLGVIAVYWFYKATGESRTSSVDMSAHNQK